MSLPCLDEASGGGELETSDFCVAGMQLSVQRYHVVPPTFCFCPHPPLASGRLSMRKCVPQAGNASLTLRARRSKAWTFLPTYFTPKSSFFLFTFTTKWHVFCLVGRRERDSLSPYSLQLWCCERLPREWFGLSYYQSWKWLSLETLCSIIRSQSVQAYIMH